jgi:hypothetical protein
MSARVATRRSSTLESFEAGTADEAGVVVRRGSAVCGRAAYSTDNLLKTHARSDTHTRAGRYAVQGAAFVFWETRIACERIHILPNQPGEMTHTSNFNLLSIVQETVAAPDNHHYPSTPQRALEDLGRHGKVLRLNSLVCPPRELGLKYSLLKSPRKVGDMFDTGLSTTSSPYHHTLSESTPCHSPAPIFINMSLPAPPQLNPNVSACVAASFIILGRLVVSADWQPHNLQTGCPHPRGRSCSGSVGACSAVDKNTQTTHPHRYMVSHKVATTSPANSSPKSLHLLPCTALRGVLAPPPCPAKCGLEHSFSPSCMVQKSLSVSSLGSRKE